MRIVREMPGDFLSLSGAEKRPSGHSPCPLGWARPGRSPKGPEALWPAAGGKNRLAIPEEGAAPAGAGDGGQQAVLDAQGLGVEGHP